MRRITEFKGKDRFLSNFYPSPVRYEEIWYPTVEHGYQAAKTLDLEHRVTISRLSKPGDAKREGRRVKLRPDWDLIKLDVMLELVRLKFAEPKLRVMLLATDDSELAEGNYWGDRYWGKVYGGAGGGWVGENHLGLILMQVRDEIKRLG